MSTRMYEVRVQGYVPTDDLPDALRRAEITEQAELLRVLRSDGPEVVEIMRAPPAADAAGTDGAHP